jgi:hypothetical protein
MSAGKPSELRLDLPGSDLGPELTAFAKWLLDDPRTVEVWGLLGARLARVECTTHETQSLELDSGDWFLVRVAPGGLLPTIPAMPTRLSGIVRFRRLVGKGGASQAGGPSASVLEPGLDSQEE